MCKKNTQYVKNERWKGSIGFRNPTIEKKIHNLKKK